MHFIKVPQPFNFIEKDGAWHLTEAIALQGEVVKVRAQSMDHYAHMTCFNTATEESQHYTITSVVFMPEQSKCLLCGEEITKRLLRQLDETYVTREEAQQACREMNRSLQRLNRFLKNYFSIQEQMESAAHLSIHQRVRAIEAAKYVFMDELTRLQQIGIQPHFDASVGYVSMS